MSELQLGLVQMTSRPGQRDHNVGRALEFIDSLADSGADLIILPEFFNTEYFAQYWDRSYNSLAESEEGYTISKLRAKAADRRVHVAAAIYEYVGPGLYFDTMFLIGSQGELVGKYRKTHPAAMRSVETLFYRAGSKYPVWDVLGFKIGAVICYDHFFPEAVRSSAIAGAELILGPFATKGIPVWRELFQVRAFENGVFMAPCNKVGTEGDWTFSGRSMVVDPRGGVRHEASHVDEESFIVRIAKDEVIAARVDYPFLRDRRPGSYSNLVASDEDVRGLPTSY